MGASDGVIAHQGWRPQLFGKKRARDVADPILEPMWGGLRVLAHVEGGAAALLDEQGERLRDALEGPAADELAEIEASIGRLVLARSAVLDGYLTPQATRPTVGAVAMGPELPSVGAMTAQFLVGRGKTRRETLTTEPDFDPDAPLAFVAVDLLAIDDESLFDVPLLERKRLLDSALEESVLVRRSSYVRPPVDSWLGSWRALGFTAIAYKAANSRYRPGVASDAWAIAPIPRG
jgi:ATP-dependent DNA ligase